jgi:predicted Zn-dependent peptidase
MPHPVTITLDCAAVLVAEPIPTAQSASLCWLIPAGSARDPDNRQGVSAMWSELLFRGAGALDSRAHADSLDRAGVQRGGEVETFFHRITATTIGSRLLDALPLIADMVLSPRCEEAAVEPVRDLALQSLEGLEDDPQERVMIEVKARHAPPPINRSGLGTREGLEALTRDDLLAYWKRCAKPTGSIIAVAGAIDPAAVARRLNELLRGWSGAPPEVAWPTPPQRGVHHEQDQTNQVQIALAHDSPPEPHPDARLERIVAGVLSGGMSGRLFTEVREKRGLCYSVFSSYATDRRYGRTVAYVGTGPERAQEALDVLVGELRRIGTPEGAITAEEFTRATVGMKSRVIMSGESTPSRAMAIARDMHRLDRPRSLEEVAAEIDAVRLGEVVEYLKRRRLGEMTVCTIGPGELKAPTP